MPSQTNIGEVVSDKMNKTVVVVVAVHKTHSVYGKKIRWTNRFKAHNEVGAKLGDQVKIRESRPYSRGVSWEVVEVLSAA